MTTLKQIADAATESKHYYWMERESAPAVTDRQIAHDVWSHLYDAALHTTGVEHDDYQRAADEVALMQMWSL